MEDVLAGAVGECALVVTTTVVKPEAELTGGPTFVATGLVPGSELERTVGVELELELPELEVLEDEVLEDEVVPLPRYAGGGTADDGLLSPPAPQGICSPEPGCVASGAGTVWPELVAMVNRAVHCLSAVLGAVNW